jgi:hypothetical protein
MQHLRNSSVPKYKVIAHRRAHRFISDLKVSLASVMDEFPLFKDRKKKGLLSLEK